MTIKTGTTTYLNAVIEQHRRDGLSEHAIAAMLAELRQRLMAAMRRERVPPERFDIEIERVMERVMKLRGTDA
jgi:hypothetical protein